VLGIFSFYFFDSEIFYYSFVKPAGHLFRFNNISFIVTEFISNPVFYFLVIISIVLISIKLYNALLRKNIYQSLGKLEVILMLQAISWFVAEIISMFKQGGNEENVQASVVLFIPFVALYVYKRSFKYKALLSLFLLFSVCLSAIRTIKFSIDNFSRNKVIEYSIQNLKIDRSANILIGDDLYLSLKNKTRIFLTQ